MKKKEIQTFFLQNTAFIEVMSKSLDFFEVWILGWMYKYLQLRFEISSREIYTRLPLKIMLGYYPGMHTQAEEFFVDVLNTNENFWR